LGGPLIYFAELVLKKLIQHGFPAGYDQLGNSETPVMVRFFNRGGFTPLFQETLQRALSIVARKLRVGFVSADGLVRLDGPYFLSFRFSKRDCKPVAVTFHRLSETPVPF